MAIDPTASNTLYAGGTWSSELFKSTDRGESWDKLDIPGFRRFYDLKVNPFQPNIVYAGTRTGLHISPDGGNSWVEANSGLSNDPSGIEISVFSENKLYMAVEDRVSSGIYVSEGDSIHWKLLGDENSFEKRINTLLVTPSEKIMVGETGIYIYDKVLKDE